MSLRFSRRASHRFVGPRDRAWADPSEPDAGSSADAHMLVRLGLNRETHRDHARINAAPALPHLLPSVATFARLKRRPLSVPRARPGANIGHHRGDVSLPPLAVTVVLPRARCQERLTGSCTN